MKKIFYTYLLFIVSLSFSQNEFITKWRSNALGTLVIPLDPASGDATITYTKFGEDIPEGELTNQSGDVTINNLDVNAEYIVSISGQYGYFSMQYSNYKLNLLSVEQWGDAKWSQWGSAFLDCENLQINATDRPDFSGISGAKSLAGAFRGCSQLSGGVSNWDVSGIEVYSQMFRDCSVFSEDLSSWSMGSQVTALTSMFLNTSIDFDFSQWNFSNVNLLTDFVSGTNLSTKNYDELLNKLYSEFSGTGQTLDATGLSYCSSREERQNLNWITGDLQSCQTPSEVDAFVTHWNVSGNFVIPFRTETGFKFDIYYEKLDDSSIKNWVYDVTGGNVTIPISIAGDYKVVVLGDYPGLKLLLSGSQTLLTSIEQWGTSEIVSLNSAYGGCTNLVINASGSPNMNLITELDETFNGCTSLESGVANWDVSEITVFRLTFKGCTNFKEDLSMWETSSAIELHDVFTQSGINFDFSDWDFSNVRNFLGDFVGGTQLSTENYDILLQKFVEAPLLGVNVSLDAFDLNYCFGETARSILIDDKGWSISGDAMRSASQILQFDLGADLTSCDPVVVIKPNFDEDITDSIVLLSNGLSGKGLKKYVVGINDSLVYAASSAEVAQGGVYVSARMFSNQDYCEYADDGVTVLFDTKPIVSVVGPYASYDTSPIDLNAGVSGSQTISWTTSGSGDFSFDNSPNSDYTPSQEDLESGMIRIRLEAGEGDCQVSDETFVVLKECDISVQKEVVDNIVRFTATNQNSKLLMSYVWEFGDGHIGRGRFVEHIYNEAKSYSVSLQATSDDGFCEKNASSEIIVADAPTTNYSISGVVRIDESTVLDTGVVGLFYLSPSNNYELKQEVGIEQDGSFMFERLVAKDYYLAARAVKESNYYNSTRPTYLGNTPSWQESDPIVLSNTAPLSGYDITLDTFSIDSEATFNKGEDIVRGNVTFDPDFVTKSGTRDIVDDPLPVQDAIILLYDENENLLSFTTTDEFGDFSFSDLESGIYVLVIEYIGTSISISQTIIVDGDDSTIDEFAFKITSDEDDETGIFITSNTLQSNAYPNPTSGIVNVGQNKRSYTIYSVTGDVITAGEIGSYQVDLTNLDPGIYLLEIQIDDQKLIERIVKR